MNAAQLIVELEKLDPDTVVLISNRDFFDTYRAPDATGMGILCEEKSPDTWYDVGDQERDRDQHAVIL